MSSISKFVAVLLEQNTYNQFNICNKKQENLIKNEINNKCKVDEINNKCKSDKINK